MDDPVRQPSYWPYVWLLISGYLLVLIILAAGWHS
jgi:hypothetical protein